MLTALTWVKGSSAKAVPVQYDHQAEDEKQGAETTNTDAMDEDLSEAIQQTEAKLQAKASDVPQTEEEMIMKEYNLDTYDDEDEEEGMEGGIFAKPEDLMIDDDPFAQGPDEEGDEEEIENNMIKPDDGLIIAAHSEEEDFSHLDIYVFEEKEDNWFLHHDIMLPAFPLCIAWMNFPVENYKNVNNNAELKQETPEKGNFVAIGTFRPEIEIWNLDVIDVLEPTMVLGGEIKDTSKANTKKTKAKKQAIQYSADSHTDAVMCLNWNNQQRHLLASGSADSKLKLWDLSKAACAVTFSHHKDKIQSVKWHHVDSNILGSASFDKTMAFIDIRNPKAVTTVKLPADIESMEWLGTHTPNCILSSLENGNILSWDLRKPQKPLWTLAAHTGAPVSALSYNMSVKGLLATGSTDKSVKYWDIESDPKLLHTLKAAYPVFSMSFYSDSPAYLAVGGQAEAPKTGDGTHNRLTVYDSKQFSTVKDRFFS